MDTVYWISGKTNFRKNAVWIVIGGVSSLITATAIADSKWYYLAVLAVPLFVYISIMKPAVFPLGVYVFLLPFDAVLSVTGSSTGTTVTKLLGILTILVLALKGIVEKKIGRLSLVSIWWIIFIAFCILSVLWAIQPELGISRIPTAAGLVLLYVFTAVYKFSREEQNIIKSFILYGGLVAAFIIIHNFVIGNTLDNSTLRTTLTFAEREAGLNQASFNFLIPISLCTAMILKQEKILRKSFFVIALSVILFGDLLTGSRGGMLGAVGILLTYLINIKKRITPLIVTLAVGAVLVFFLPNYFIVRLGQSVADGGAGRVDIWAVGWKMLGKYWLIGTGLDNFPVAYTEFASYAHIFRGVARAAHNTFLCLLVELGIFGISLFVCGVVKHYRAISIRYTRDGSEEIPLKAAFWGILISSLFIDAMWLKTFWLLWMLIMIHRNTAITRV